jgi:hypothetical protein
MQWRFAIDLAWRKLQRRRATRTDWETG